MVKVRLIDMSIEKKKKELRAFGDFGKKNTRWYAIMTLNLIDEGAGRSIPEWFYLVVCSKEYFEKPFERNLLLKDTYVLLQDEFDPAKALDVAREKMKKIKASNWDEFYAQMESQFLYEDSYSH